MYRRRRWFAILTVVAAVVVGVGTQASSSFSTLLPKNEGVAQREPAPGGAPAEDAGAPAEGTVLSVERRSSGLQPVEKDQESPGSGEAREQTEPPEASEASEEPLNVLILGVDRRPSESQEAGRSDTIMLAQVTPGTGRVELLSVPRDLLVEVEPGVEDRINNAYAYGGVEQARAVMEGVTGVPIDAHAIIDFQGFEDVVDAMGGVEVDVEDEIPPKYEIQDGPQVLDGEQALFYARYRKTAGGDLDRIRHQQKVLAALRARILSWNTVTKLPSMLKIAYDNVDTDLGLFQGISLGRALAAHSGEGDLQAVQLKGYPETLDSGAQVLVPDYEANEAILADFRK